jgi:hypothetical protein
MNILIKVISLVVGIHLLIFASAVNSRAWENGYNQDKGNLMNNGYEQRGYERTAPNGVQQDNYSAYGNVNPYNNQVGYERDRPSYDSGNTFLPAQPQNDATRIFNRR